MAEVDLLDSYPRTKRPIDAREAARPEQRELARQFGRAYFDGDRTQGYGGYRYDGRWQAVAARMRDHFGLRRGARILDVGCAKGFLLHDFREAVPDAQVAGLDVSRYGIEHAMDSVRPCLVVGTAECLPFRNGSFDLVVSINTLHNLDRVACVSAVREIERVGRGRAYIQVDSWFNDEQRLKFERWQLTPLTYFEPDGWRALFTKAGYTGDYYWTITE